MKRRQFNKLAVALATGLTGITGVKSGPLKETFDLDQQLIQLARQPQKLWPYHGERPYPNPSGVSEYDRVKDDPGGLHYRSMCQVT